jgi:hypothetical protein
MLYQLLFSNGVDTVIHVLLAAGFLLLAMAVFDFDRLPKSITWIACLAAVAEGTIFLLQGVSHLIDNAAFTQLIYQRLGHWPERLLMDLVILWCVALWLTDSQGRTRLIGLVALIIAVGMEGYSYIRSYMDSSINTAGPGLAMFLLPFVWLLLESSKRTSPVHRLNLSVQQKETT